MKQKIAIEIICFVLIFLFIYAALSKLLAYKIFQQQLTASPLLKLFSSTLAWAIPLIEIIISFLLTVNQTRLIGLFTSFILLFLFTVYIAVMLLSVSHLPCSCGGIIKDLSWKQHIAFNSAFIFLALTGIYLLKKQKSIAAMQL